MQIRFVCTAALVGGVIAAGLPVVAAPARAAGPAQPPQPSQPSPHSPHSDERRLVVVEAPGNVLAQSARDKLHSAIAEVVVRHGLVVASPGMLPEKLRACDLPGCLAPIAAASGAIFVLRIDAKFAKESFKLVVELWNSDEGKLLGSDRRDCPICDEQDLWGSAALLTQGLLERAVRGQATPAARDQLSEGHVAVPAPSSTVPEAPAQASGQWAKYPGIALSVAGLAASVVGLYYLAVDGNSVGNQSDRVRDTRKLGLPMTIAGGSALVCGLGLLTWHYWPGPAKVSVGPSGLQIAGQF